MFNARVLTAAGCFTAAAIIAPFICAQENAPAFSLLDIKPGAESLLKPSSGQVTATYSADGGAGAINLNIAPGPDGYPGVTLKPEKPWDLSKYGHIEVRVTNTGANKTNMVLRVDNDGDWQQNPWNGETIYLDPGQSGTLKTIFGYSWGFKKAYPLKPNAVTDIMLFSGKTDKPQSFRIDAIVATGPAGETPPVNPNDVREKPVDGFILGGGAKVDAAKQLSAQGAQPVLSGEGKAQSLKVVFPASKNDATATIKPLMGRWDLGDSLQVRVKVRNTGTAPVVPKARVQTDAGSTDWISAAPVAPNATAEIVVPFGGKINDFSDPKSGNQLATQITNGVSVGVAPADVEQTLVVESIRAEMPPAPKLPDWLGKRPPVPGDWVKTLDDEFDSTTLDASVWNVTGPNYWDKVTHWSKDNVILDGKTVKLRYEKKSGHNDDDPAQPETPYQAGYLHTYNRWVQRYGYFEARMKLPKTPGLWPAFWMMPDRGIEAAGGPEQWRRQDTNKGGMEFDIVEHLTIWGPNRYSAGEHWDGYDKDHKSNGSSYNYVQPDKDGYITGGLLWTPGSATYYCNGQEIAHWNNDRISNVPSILMFTLPSGGWDYNTLDESKLPDDFVIDYVRCWQRKDLASPVDGKHPDGK